MNEERRTDTEFPDDIEPAATGASRVESSEISLGERLRRARQAKGMDISAVADALKLRRAYITALEEGDVENLPEGYAVGFLRAYVRFLGESLVGRSVGQAVEEFKAHAQLNSRRYEARFPSPVEDVRTPRLPFLIASVLLAAMTYVIWYAVMDEGPRMVPPAPVMENAMRAPLPDVTSVRAVAPIWVDAWLESGERLFNGMLQPGEVISVPQADMALIVSAPDAAALELVQSGVVQGRLGSEGQLLQELRLGGSETQVSQVD